MKIKKYASVYANPAAVEDSRGQLGVSWENFLKPTPAELCVNRRADIRKAQVCRNLSKLVKQ